MRIVVELWAFLGRSSVMIGGDRLVAKKTTTYQGEDGLYVSRHLNRRSRIACSYVPVYVQERYRELI